MIDDILLLLSITFKSYGLFLRSINCNWLFSSHRSSNLPFWLKSIYSNRLFHAHNSFNYRLFLRYIDVNLLNSICKWTNWVFLVKSIELMKLLESHNCFIKIQFVTSIFSKELFMRFSFINFEQILRFIDKIFQSSAQNNNIYFGRVSTTVYMTMICVNYFLGVWNIS